MKIIRKCKKIQRTFFYLNPVMCEWDIIFDKLCAEVLRKNMQMIQIPSPIYTTQYDQNIRTIFKTSLCNSERLIICPFIETLTLVFEEKKN